MTSTYAGGTDLCSQKTNNEAINSLTEMPRFTHTLLTNDIWLEQRPLNTATAPHDKNSPDFATKPPLCPHHEPNSRLYRAHL